MTEGNERKIRLRLTTLCKERGTNEKVMERGDSNSMKGAGGTEEEEERGDG